MFHHRLGETEKKNHTENERICTKPKAKVIRAQIETKQKTVEKYQDPKQQSGKLSQKSHRSEKYKAFKIKVGAQWLSMQT